MGRWVKICCMGHTKSLLLFNNHSRIILCNYAIVRIYSEQNCEDPFYDVFFNGLGSPCGNGDKPPSLRLSNTRMQLNVRDARVTQRLDALLCYLSFYFI